MHIPFLIGSVLYKIKVIVFSKQNKRKKSFCAQGKEEEKRRRRRRRENLFEKTKYCELRRKHTHENKTNKQTRAKKIDHVFLLFLFNFGLRTGC